MDNHSNVSFVTGSIIRLSGCLLKADRVSKCCKFSVSKKCLREIKFYLKMKMFHIG